MTTSKGVADNMLGLKPIALIPCWRTKELIDLKSYTFQEEVVSKDIVIVIKHK